MADGKIPKPDGILSEAPPSKPVSNFSPDAIYAGAPSRVSPNARNHFPNKLMNFIWAIAAGRTFALVRFLVVWRIVDPFDPNQDGSAQAIARLPWIAATSA